LLRLFLFPGVQKKATRKKTRKVKSNQMNEGMENLKQIEELEQDKKNLYKVVDKLENRISTLEKVLQSHAKCIGEIRGDKNGS
tara:strand:+ start:848 stop:1096 length:249 start_codon:yes stop_codon:yes gene_type:complete